MFSFSYVLLPTLKKELENISETRNKVFIELISPRHEIALKFEAKAEIISSSLELSDRPVSKRDVLSVIEREKGRLKNDTVGEILQTKKALDYIRREWQLADENITSEAIYELVKMQETKTRTKKSEIVKIINFILVSPEHPVVQSALAFILMYDYLPEKEAMRIATNVSRLFLYKFGYDFREMLNLEEYFIKDMANFKKTLDNGIKDKNISAFLLYFVQAVSIRGEKVLKNIKNREIEAKSYKLYDLTDRQKKIIILFNIPETKITNRNIQKQFKISQVTASRDLAKLFSIGIIFPNGKGRSVYYTKV